MKHRSEPSPRRLRVVAIPAFSNRKTNPYNFLLYSAMGRLSGGGPEIREYASFRSFISGGIIHLHWPDYFWNRPSLLFSMIRGICFLMECLLWKCLGNRIVWTAHNLGPHDKIHPRLSAVFGGLLNRLTDAVILLSRSSESAVLRCFPILEKKARCVIPHGHYREILQPLQGRNEARKILGLPDMNYCSVYFGLIREYKNVENLVQVFAELPESSGCLVVAGRIDSGERRKRLTEEAAKIPNVILRDAFLDDGELQVVVESADLVILPYSEVLNSGSVIYALSNNRPVLVPDTPTFRELAETLPRGWIHFFPGVLTPEHIRQALAQGQPNPAVLELSSLSWDEIARRHLEFFTVSQELLSSRSR